MRALVVALVVTLVSPAAVLAQRGSAAAKKEEAAKAGPLAAVSDTYSYSPDGRRDPFLNLLAGGTGETRATGRRGEGPAGMAVADISVRGVLDSRGTFVAMVQGPDKKTYLVHSGDKLLDGTIKAITTEGLVITQQVNDPLSIVKQREIRKLLRSVETSKE